MKEEIWDILGKLASDNCSPEEEKRLLQQLESEGIEPSMIADMRRSWELSGKVSLSEGPEVDVNAEWDRFSSQIGEEAPPNKSPLWLQAAAAVIVLALIGIFVFRSGGSSDYERELYSETQDLQSQLSDGSQVELAAGSRLEYNDTFAENERRVKLSGSARFEVKPIQKRPFIVETSLGSVMVLGTVFKVDAREKGDSLILMVESGRVAFFPKKGKADTLEADQRLVHSTDTQKSQVSEVKKGLPATLEFDGTPVSEVLSLVKARLGLGLELEKPSMANCPYTGSFDAQWSAEDFLLIFCSSMEWEYKLEPSGSYLIKGEGCP